MLLKRNKNPNDNHLIISTQTITTCGSRNSLNLLSFKITVKHIKKLTKRCIEVYAQKYWICKRGIKRLYCTNHPNEDLLSDLNNIILKFYSLGWFFSNR